MIAGGEHFNILSPETGLSIGSAIIGASALVVFIGTSAPLVSKKVDTSFYANLHIPIAITLMLVNGLTMLLKWKQSGLNEMFKKGTLALILSLVAETGLYLAGIEDLDYLAIAAAPSFAFILNV